MKTEVGFWDTSAILLLCLQQLGSDASRRYSRRFPRKVMWWGTPVEIESALDRLHRNQKIDDHGLQQARRTWHLLRRSIVEVQPRERVRAVAEGIPRSYGLRAPDSFQLAAALEWCRERPRHRAFVTFDLHLAEAASRVGFSVYS